MLQILSTSLNCIILFLTNMLVEARPLPMQSHETTFQSSRIQETENHMPSDSKIQMKPNKLGASKILIGIAVIFIVALVGYKLYSLAYAGAAASKIDEAHNSKIIQNAGSSSGKDSGSTSGNSQSSKTSRDSSKPMNAAATAGRGIISPSDTGSSMGSSGDDGEDPNQDEEDNDGEKRNQKMKNNKMSDTTSTDEDDSDGSEEDQEDSEDVDEQGMSYNPVSQMPMVGSTRP